MTIFWIFSLGLVKHLCLLILQWISVLSFWLKMLCLEIWRAEPASSGVFCFLLAALSVSLQQWNGSHIFYDCLWPARAELYHFHLGNHVLYVLSRLDTTTAAPLVLCKMSYMVGFCSSDGCKVAHNSNLLSACRIWHLTSCDKFKKNHSSDDFKKH